MAHKLNSLLCLITRNQNSGTLLSRNMDICDVLIKQWRDLFIEVLKEIQKADSSEISVKKYRGQR
jgi:hypothetical protein